MAAACGHARRHVRGLDIGPIDRLCIACSVEEEYGIELPDATIDAWRTIADVVASVDTAATGQAA